MKRKIVRDKIPGLFEKDGVTHYVEQLDKLYGPDMLGLLGDKLIEEAREVAEALLSGNEDNLIEEIGDVRDVLGLIKHQYAISDREVEEVGRSKAEKKGGFAKGYVITYG